MPIPTRSMTFSDEELDHLSVLLMEIQIRLVKESHALREPRLQIGDGFSEHLSKWAERAADLRAKIEGRD